jgi:hypothetical protein
MAYRSINPDWKAKSKEIVYLALLDKSATREEIAEYTGLKKDTVNGRAHDLLKDDLIEVIGVKPVRSGNMGEVLAVKIQVITSKWEGDKETLPPSPTPTILPTSTYLLPTTTLLPNLPTSTYQVQPTPIIPTTKNGNR